MKLATGHSIFLLFCWQGTFPTSLPHHLRRGSQRRCVPYHLQESRRSPEPSFSLPICIISASLRGATALIRVCMAVLIATPLPLSGCMDPLSPFSYSSRLVWRNLQLSKSVSSLTGTPSYWLLGMVAHVDPRVFPYRGSFS
jgi:hypothetical protein